MEIDPESISPRSMYHWMTSTILPRPIAWVSTVSKDGATNLAPFSFFAGVCARPPTLMFCPANDRFGRPKDTLVNIEETGEFVVNLVPYRLAEAMNATAASLPHGQSEFTKFGVAQAAALKVKPPRVADSPVCFECRLDRVVRFGEGPIAGNAVFGRILHLHIDDAMVGADGTADARMLDLVGRAGGDQYIRLEDYFRMERPD